MHILRTWGRILLVAMLFLIISPDVLAQRSTTKLRTTEIARNDTPPQEHERAGSPELGVLILIGVVGLLIFVAWVFSRIGEGSSRQSDNTMN